MKAKKKKKLTAEQKKALQALNTSIKDRQTRDMAKLIQMPEFLRYVGRITVACGCHAAIEGSDDNNVHFREGMRSVGEKMLSELKHFNFEKLVEVERQMFRDAKLRRRIVNDGAELSAEELSKLNPE